MANAIAIAIAIVPVIANGSSSSKRRTTALHALTCLNVSIELVLVISPILSRKRQGLHPSRVEHLNDFRSDVARATTYNDERLCRETGGEQKQKD